MLLLAVKKTEVIQIINGRERKPLTLLLNEEAEREQAPLEEEEAAEVEEDFVIENIEEIVIVTILEETALVTMIDHLIDLMKIKNHNKENLSIYSLVQSNAVKNPLLTNLLQPLQPLQPPPQLDQKSTLLVEQDHEMKQYM